MLGTVLRSASVPTRPRGVRRGARASTSGRATWWPRAGARGPCPVGAGLRRSALRHGPLQVLRGPAAARSTQGNQVGVCAMGPVGDGDKLIWMRVWVWQQDGDDVAASSGDAGDQVPGAHPLGGTEMPPFALAEEKKWMVQTKLEPSRRTSTSRSPRSSRRWRCGERRRAHHRAVEPGGRPPRAGRRPGQPDHA